MPLKVGLCYDLESDFPFSEDAPADANSEFDSARTIEGLKKAIHKAGYKLIDLGNYSEILKLGDKLKTTADIIFNYTEGVKGRNREAQVPSYLEYLQIPFTGSDALTMAVTLDKVFTKQILISYKIPTAKYFSYSGEMLKNLKLDFPLIVKPRWEGSSMGINADSVVKTKKELIKRADFIVKQYKQPALVEEFIKGAEYTVPIIENNPPKSLIPIKVVLNGDEMGINVYHNSYIKADSTQSLDYIPLTQNRKLADRLSELAIRTYNTVNCLDLARVDFRVNDKGQIFVLELNPIPALNTLDAMAISAKHMGLEFPKLIKKIIESALMRYKLKST